jgi:2-haloalkanoic acid dehalogenase type II
MKPFLFFDLGGTLVDLRGIVTSMAARLEKWGVQYPVPLALTWATQTAELLPSAQGSRFRPERDIAADMLFELLERHGRPIARSESTRLVRDAWNEFVESCSLHADASKAWLGDLRAQTAKQCIVTDGDSEAVASVLAHLGLNGLFDSVTISENVRSYKPDSRIYRVALETCGAKASESLFVSDSALDLQGAASLGIAGALIRRNLLPDLAKPPPRAAVLPDLRGVRDLVDAYSRVGQFQLG